MTSIPDAIQAAVEFHSRQRELEDRLREALESGDAEAVVRAARRLMEGSRDAV